ncbi:SUN domain-containing protein 3-like isoform X2 [Phascolarctos cinereus]|uniref:SUN domain-containing protein 3-like isoform X2 n=1 Tax=Phascolarctos cinereus TaxID=38626 RepID=A0A6P5JAE2_PHACI|nr:SUN domain-containing protein 3-like isoform X2 [Phascolarctos cinereus]
MERVRACLNREYYSWKIMLSMMFFLASVFIGLHNSENLTRTGLSHIPRHLYELSVKYGTQLYNYQARIRMGKGKIELLKKGSRDLENNSKQILSLTKRIDILKALLKDLKEKLENDILKADADVFGKPEISDITDEEMSLVNYILKKLREDQVQMADYALKSAGASIVEAWTSESYKNDKAKLHWHEIGFLHYEMPPDIILQPDVHPGKCWAFPGSTGHTVIKLARKIIPRAVTMEHISEKISPSGSTASAPKDFSVYNAVSEYILYIKLKILTNWGHSKYTCLYRFRVHGKPEQGT